ncbi:N-methylhydantoinase A [Constrictibacter sp. MBR-5]|jgi:N-methylhydantoinase A/oxoprolinase/acetone carboxylase beta subunit|uniref:hydantoinase/oxoprolinase family protein n=1 Tax=Constrictibacter sp. MBR-5 TaxID=3156467 RepID=UPI0033964359
MYLIGVDVGGTFTDIVLADTGDGSGSGRTIIHKTPTTPDDPSRGVVRGIAELCERFGVPRDAIDHVLHGTTIATNAALEYDGAVTGMITTEGYRDILHIGRHQRPQHYSIRQEIPWQDRPLVRRRHRLTVEERLVPPRGEVRVPLDEEGVRAAARELKAAGVEAIAVCFLFSYLNPAHEERARAIVQEEYPDCFVCTSAGVSPQFREFERFTTAALNAFIGPKVRTYVNRLEQTLAEEGFRADLHVMGSNGGVATAAMVADHPILTLLSGPAAGVLGGAWCGALAGRTRLITFDVGGTSADIGITIDGRFAEATARDTWIGGYPVMAPMIDIHTIGAGGGSIALVDEAGAFKVGPRSAGAQPGPAAYGRGGTLPTVTDANVVLGRLDPDNFLGGEMGLDVAAARRVIDDLAARLGMSAEAAAEGVLTIINANMANAIRSRTVQKGLDPRDFALVAFGGAGPLHGADVARALGIPEVIVPPYPGITSAVGLLTTDLRYDAIRTEFQVSGALDLERLRTDFAAMRDDLAARFRADGVDPAEVTFERAGDLRYVGQGYELRVPFPEGDMTEAAAAQVLADFAAAHRKEYGHVFEQSPVEIVNIRVTGVGHMPKIGAPEPEGGASVAEARVKTGRCVFRTASGLETLDTPFYRREALPLGEAIHGPAIVLQKDSTTVVPPDATFTSDPSGNLILRLETL